MPRVIFFDALPKGYYKKSPRLQPYEIYHISLRFFYRRYINNKNLQKALSFLSLFFTKKHNLKYNYFYPIMEQAYKLIRFSVSCDTLYKVRENLEMKCPLKKEKNN